MKENLVKNRLLWTGLGRSAKSLHAGKKCGICGEQAMANTVLCNSDGKWMHGICEKNKMVSLRLVIGFRCRTF